MSGLLRLPAELLDAIIEYAVIEPSTVLDGHRVGQRIPRALLGLPLVNRQMHSQLTIRLPWLRTIHLQDLQANMLRFDGPSGLSQVVAAAQRVNLENVRQIHIEQYWTPDSTAASPDWNFYDVELEALTMLPNLRFLRLSVGHINHLRGGRWKNQMAEWPTA